MIKKILVLCLVPLLGCGPASFTSLVGIRKFSVGDCVFISLKPAEKWSVGDYKVIALGNNSYRIKKYRPEYEEDLAYGHFWEDFYQKAPCPEESK